MSISSYAGKLKKFLYGEAALKRIVAAEFIFMFNFGVAKYSKIIKYRSAVIHPLNIRYISLLYINIKILTYVNEYNVHADI